MNDYETLNETSTYTFFIETPLFDKMQGLGLDKICLAKFKQNGQPKERSSSASKMGRQFVKKAKWAKNEL